MIDWRALSRISRHVIPWDGRAMAEPCWEWTARRTACGYGQIGAVNGRGWLVHRLTWTAFHGPIGDGLEIDHLCRNRSCCNPAHLEPVDHAENMARAKTWSYNSAKTHCKQGHEFTAENTGITTQGWRNCRTCDREAMRARRRAQRCPGSTSVQEDEQ